LLVLGIIFIIISIILGLAISLNLRMGFGFEERLFLSIIVGHAVSIWVVFALSYWQRTLNTFSIVAGTLICALAAIVALKKRLTASLTSIFTSSDAEIRAVAIFATAAFLVLNLHEVLMVGSIGAVYGSLHVSVDYPFHISLISSFVYENNFPPVYPQLINTPLRYPLIVDFYSAILMKTGFDLRSSLIVPNMLFQVASLCLIACFARRLTSKKYVGLLAALLFFFAGNFGFLYAPGDIARQGGFINWITNLPRYYTGTGGLDLPGIRFGNPITVMMMPSRHVGGGAFGSSFAAIESSIVVMVMLTLQFPPRIRSASRRTEADLVTICTFRLDLSRSFKADLVSLFSSSMGVYGSELLDMEMGREASILVRLARRRSMKPSLALHWKALRM